MCGTHALEVVCTQMPTDWKTHVRLPVGAVCPVESFLRVPLLCLPIDVHSVPSAP